MFNELNEEIKKEIIKAAIENLTNPFEMLTVKDVAKDLYMGQNKTNEIFRRKDFPSINIGKVRKVQKLSYILWKMDKKIDVVGNAI